MILYETVFILRHDLPADQVQAVTQNYVEMIQKAGGKVVKVEPWGLRPLAYRIRKNTKGHYALLQIDAPSAAMQSCENAMRLDEDVLRSLTIRVDAHDPEPSAILRRDDRDAPPAPRSMGGRPTTAPSGLRTGGSFTNSGRTARPSVNTNDSSVESR